jgi:hypothetical protein
MVFPYGLKCDLALVNPAGLTADKSCNLFAEAVVVTASEKDAVAVAFNVTLADDDVAVAVNLCGVHGSFSFVVMDDGLPDHCLIVKAEHDGSK